MPATAPAGVFGVTLEADNGVRCGPLGYAKCQVRVPLAALEGSARTRPSPHATLDAYFGARVAARGKGRGLDRKNVWR